MKSHVREALVRDYLYSCMSFKDIGNGERLVVFNDFAEELIAAGLNDETIKLSQWIIDASGNWSVSCNKLEDRVTGSSISNCISNTLKLIRGKANDS